MKSGNLPSGRQRGIPFLLPDDWSPEQALAVLELLDDLREVLWARYQIRVQELLNDDFCNGPGSGSYHIEEEDPPF